MVIAEQTYNLPALQFRENKDSRVAPGWQCLKTHLSVHLQRPLKRKILARLDGCSILHKLDGLFYVVCFIALFAIANGKAQIVSCSGPFPGEGFASPNRQS